MTAALLPTLTQLLPGRLEAVFDVSNDGGRPDVTLRGALITHRFGLDQVDEAFATLRDKPDGFIKSVVRIR